jgi:hypothetical protein
MYLYKVNGRLLVTDESKRLMTFFGEDFLNDKRIFDPTSKNVGGFNSTFGKDALVLNPNVEDPKLEGDQWGRVKGLYARNNKVTPAFKVIRASGGERDWDLKSCIIFSKPYNLIPKLEEEDTLIHEFVGELIF